MGVSRKQIYLDIKALINKGIDKDTLQQATLQINSSLVRVAKSMHNIIVTGTKTEKTRAAKVLLDATEKHTDFLERFGIKEKIANTVENKVEISWKDDNKDNDHKSSDSNKSVKESKKD